MEKMRNEKKTAKKVGEKTGDLCGFLSISPKELFGQQRLPQEMRKATYSALLLTASSVGICLQHISFFEKQ